jgi:hypothetical protein
VPEEDVRWSASSGKTPTVGSASNIAAGLQLQAHPNPTSGGVTIQHALPQGALEGTGSISIIDVQGRQIAHVWRGELAQAPGQFEWDGLDSAGARVATGRYLIRLESRGEVVATGWVTMMP